MSIADEGGVCGLWKQRLIICSLLFGVWGIAFNLIWLKSPLIYIIAITTFSYYIFL